MAQARDNTFNPSSPHSSSGGADSYKHDGTPDTRLTAFSPDESSARSTKILKSLGSSSESQPLRFPVQQASNYGTQGIQAEKDPFVTSNSAVPGGLGGKSEAKLSPTASAFRPVSVPVVVRGSAESITPLNLSSQFSASQSIQSTTSKLSKDLGLFRDLIIASDVQVITPSAIEIFLLVCSP
jgi:hypothetical protein